MLLKKISKIKFQNVIEVKKYNNISIHFYSLNKELD